MSKHTPTPWKRWSRDPDRYAVRIVAKGKLVAEARAAGGPWADAEANARLIVKAVNHHDELVDVLEDLLSTEKCVCESSNVEPGECSVCTHEKLLKKIKGKSCFGQ